MATAVVLFFLVVLLLSLLTHEVKIDSLKHHEIMDEHDIKHIRHMIRFSFDSTIVKYLVLRKRTLWEKVRGKVGIHAFTVEYTNEDKTEYSEFYKTISAGKYFFMKLKGWTEITDRKTAVKAMNYLKWDRNIP